MNKEKEIEEVYDIIDDTIYIQYDWLYGKREAAENIVNAGYRKADEVRKETANSMYKYFKELRWHFDDWQWAAIYTACKAHGAEVDE